MELRRHRSLRIVVTLGYFLALATYLVVGLSPAEAVQYEVSARLSIPDIGLESDVTKLELNNHRLDTPDVIVGSYTRFINKTLLVGHASTVFQDLNLVTVGQIVVYGGNEYTVEEISLYKKEDVDMDKVLSPATRDTLVMMTCAGEVHGVDASHRLLLVAVR